MTVHSLKKELKEIGTYAENYLKDNKIDVKNEESQTVIDVVALQKDGNVQITSSRIYGSEDFENLCIRRQSRWKIITGKQKKNETLKDGEALVFLEDVPLQSRTLSLSTI